MFPVSTRLRLLIDVSGARTVVRLAGHWIGLDEANALELRQRLLHLVQEGRHRLILDLANVYFLTSTTVEAFLAVRRRLRAVGGRLSLRNLTPPVAEVFTVLNLADLLDVHMTIPENILSN